MDISSEARQMSDSITTKTKYGKIIDRRWFTYLFMVALLMYLLICGYVLVFSGSLFVEAVAKGWYRASASEYDAHSFMLGYLYGFASLMGVVGGMVVLSTKPQRYYRYKVLMFIPSVVWSSMLSIGNLRWGFQYWTQWLFLIPIMLLCIFVLVGVVKKVNIPYFADTR